MTDKILFIDDENDFLTAIERKLRQDYDIIVVTSGKDAIDTLKSDGPIAVAVCDMRLPEMDGVATLEAINKFSPETVRLMLSGNAEQQTVVDAINKGQIFRFLNKPCKAKELRAALEDALIHHESITAEKKLLKTTIAGSVKVLMDVLAMTDPHAFGQATRVREWMHRVAQVMSLKNAWDLEMAATLMPLGLVAVPPDVLAKVREGEYLSNEEQDVFEAAPGAAWRLIQNIPRLNEVATMVYYQSKSFNGDGYPYDDDISGEDIPFGSRILRILGDLGKITKEGKEPGKEDIDELRENKRQYDPKLLKVVVDIWGHVSSIKAQRDTVAKEVGIDLLMEGDIITEDVRLNNGGLLLSVGHTVTEAHIERMKGIREATGGEGGRAVKEPIQIERLQANV